MKLGTVYRVRINTRDYRTILDLLDNSGVNTDESSDILVGLTLSTLLEVFREADLKGDFLKKVHQIRTAWNVSGSEPRQEGKQGQKELVPLEQQDTMELLAELERLEGLKHLPGTEQYQARIRTILINRNTTK